MESLEAATKQHQFAGSGTRWARYRHVLASLLLLAIIPSVSLITSRQLTIVSGPQWLGSNFENSYPYLFNSLLIAIGQPPAHIDHPGTTTQLFGAACLQLSGHGSGDSLIRSVIDHPEQFLKKIHRALLTFCALALWLFPWRLALRVESLIAGMLVQIPSLFFNIVFSYSIWFGSDLMLVAFSIAATSICALLIHQRDSSSQAYSTAVFAGIACGLGIVTKLTFFPLVLISIFCCSGFKKILTFSLAFAVAAGVTLIPIYSELPQLFRWAFGLATHSGYYGSGDLGFARSDRYWLDIVHLLFGNPSLGAFPSGEPSVLFIPILATITIVFCPFVRSAERSRSFYLKKAGCGIFLLQIFCFLVIAKHPHDHYLIPLCLSTGLNLFVLFKLLERVRMATVLPPFIVVLLLLLLTCGMSNFLFRIPYLYSYLQKNCADQLSLYQRVNKRTSNDLRADFYRSIAPEFALYFGNVFARRNFSQLLEERYPRALFFNVFNGKFDTFKAAIDPAVILDEHHHFYLFGMQSYMKLGSASAWREGSMIEVDRQGDYVLQEWTRR